MATAANTVAVLRDDVITYTWTITSANADGAPIQPDKMGWSDRVITVTGSFGTGSGLKVEGSNDGTNWFGLKDAFGVAISLSAAGLSSIAEVPLYIRPNLTTPGSGASLTVIISARKAKNIPSRG